MLDESERLRRDGLLLRPAGDLPLPSSDPIGYEKLFSRIRGGLVSARETALNISASPIVRELGELCFALYTPEGDSIALSTGIIVHVHTMSDAIKYMVRSDYEDNPKVRPGDIFANNDPVIGDVHNADVQTFVPIFWEGELVAWAGGVTHVLDIGASTPGGVPVGPTNRLDDGIDLPCIKIGEGDELAQWHLTRCEKQTRAPMYYLLDEKTRLAGCHIIREAVERVILEEGVDRFKDFSREVIEEGRRSFKSRIREMTVPGRYRSPSFWEITFADKEQLPARARVDTCMHSAWEVRIGGDGEYALDMDGTSSWGYHSMNCTPSGMQGAIWVMFTQTLICSDKVNDGAYLAVETNFPEGSIANLGQAEGFTGIAWAFLQPAFTGYPRTHLAGAPGARLHRGGHQRLLGVGQRPAGRRHRPVRQLQRDHELRGRRPGHGRQVRARRHRDLRRHVQPRGRHGRRGDVGADLAVRLPLAQGQGLDRRAGSPPRRVELRVAVHDLEHALLGAPEPRHQQALLGLGAVRRLSRQRRLHPQHQGRRPDRARGARRGYPIADGDFENPALMEIQGEREYKLDAFTTLSPFTERRPVPVGDEGRRRPGRPAAAAGRGRGGGRARGAPAAALRRVGLRASPTATPPRRGDWSGAARSRNGWPRRASGSWRRTSSSR